MRRLLGTLIGSAIAASLFLVLSTSTATPVHASSCTGQYDRQASTTIGSLQVNSELVAAHCPDGNWQYTGYLYSFGGNMTGPEQISVRVWVCGTYQGTWSTYIAGNTNTMSVTTPEFSYGSCGLQADDSGSYFHVGATYYSAPYVNF